MKIFFSATRFLLLVFLARAAQADMIQGTVTDAGTHAPLAGVKVTSGSAHSVFTGTDGKFNLDTQGGTAAVLPQSREPAAAPKKNRLATTAHSLPQGAWTWYNLLGRPVGGNAAAKEAGHPSAGPADQANANAGLTKSAAAQGLDTLSFEKTGYLPLSKDVNGSQSDVAVQMEPVSIGGNVDSWYEAEAAGNILFNILGSGGRTKCGSTCSGVPHEGSVCCMGGYKITQLLGRCDTRASSGNAKSCQNDQGPGGAGVAFAGVKVPKAGTYDITWWYHAGANDNWNDHDCGGNPAPAWMTYYNPKANPQPGCRPHLIAVNGKEIDGSKGERYWQFPVYGGSWDALHAATTTLTLAAGDNTVQLAAPRIGDEDAVDIDAIHVQAANKGELPKVVAPTVFAGDGQK